MFVNVIFPPALVPLVFFFQEFPLELIRLVQLLVHLVELPVVLERLHAEGVHEGWQGLFEPRVLFDEVAEADGEVALLPLLQPINKLRNQTPLSHLP